MIWGRQSFEENVASRHYSGTKCVCLITASILGSCIFNDPAGVQFAVYSLQAVRSAVVIELFRYIDGVQLHGRIIDGQFT